MKSKQELHCHACNKYVQFEIDLSLNGNHVLNCPNCGHEHCRVVKKGVITGDRWDSRNGPAIWTNATTYTSTSIYTSSGTSSIYIYQAWADTTVTTGSTGTW